MVFSYLPESKSTYVVMHRQGLGVMESPLEDVEIVYETNCLDQAKRKANIFSKVCVSNKERKSGWIFNHFDVYTNTATEEGKRLYEEWKKEFKEKWDNARNNPDYKLYQLKDGSSIMTQHDDLYDGPTKL